MYTLVSAALWLGACTLPSQASSETARGKSKEHGPWFVGIPSPTESNHHCWYEVHRQSDLAHFSARSSPQAPRTPTASRSVSATSPVLHTEAVSTFPIAYEGIAPQIEQQIDNGWGIVRVSTAIFVLLVLNARHIHKVGFKSDMGLPVRQRQEAKNAKAIVALCGAFLYAPPFLLAGAQQVQIAKESQTCMAETQASVPNLCPAPRISHADPWSEAIDIEQWRQRLAEQGSKPDDPSARGCPALNPET